MSISQVCKRRPRAAKYLAQDHNSGKWGPGMWDPILLTAGLHSTLTPEMSAVYGRGILWKKGIFHTRGRPQKQEPQPRPLRGLQLA